MKMKRNIDDAMMSSLGLLSDYENTDHKKIDKIASDVKDSVLEKNAGIYIYQPTQDNVEDFVRKYIYNELTFFPRILELIVTFLPSAFDNIDKGMVKDGSGLIQIKVRSKMVELPFMVVDGELEPFDVIQMEGQRCPYSRENFRKIIINLDAQIEREEKGETSESPYAGLSDYTNPTTSGGFMGDVLSIRDSQSYRNGGSNYVTAASEYTEMEKKAGAFVTKTIKDLGKEQAFSLLSSHPEIANKVKEDTGIDINNYIPHDKTATEIAEEILKSANEYDAMGLGWTQTAPKLEDGFERAVAQAEKEKSTTPAPETGKDEVNKINKSAFDLYDNFMKEYENKK